MYKTINEAIELTNALKREFYCLETLGLEVVFCPPYTALSDVSELIMDTDIQLGAQDLYWQDEGAFTGEVSGKMLKDAGCKFVIIGHSERRQFFGETNETVNKKIPAALSSGLTPIVCIGENLSEREKGSTFKVLTDHIENGLRGLSPEDAQKMIIAYEPVWAIGTGKTATPAQAQEAHKFIRDLLKKLYTEEIATGIRIQYGGSVKPENAFELIKQPDIDGALVGGASLSVEGFSQIVKKASEVKK